AAANRMDHLIQDVLTLSRAARAEVPLTEIDIDALVRGILDSYPNLQSRQADIVIEGTLPKVQGNEAALTQCFSNLLGNAVKFVPLDRTPKVRIWAERVGGFVRVLVQDNGVGVPPEATERIFRIFERVDDN